MGLAKAIKGQKVSVSPTPVNVLDLVPFDIFPTRIWHVKLPELASHFPEWIAAVEEMRAANPEPAGRSNRQGWNSKDKAVLGKPIFRPLRTSITHAVQKAFVQMGIPSQGFTLESWVNIHDRNGFNFSHVHQGCILSGSFYLRAPEGSGELAFRDPRPGVINAPLKGPVANGCRDIKLRPVEGLLVLFPSWLEHFVEPHMNDVPRISIPFNAIKR